MNKNAFISFAQFDQNLGRLCGWKLLKFIYHFSDFYIVVQLLVFFPVFKTNIQLSVGL